MKVIPIMDWSFASLATILRNSAYDVTDLGYGTTFIEELIQSISTENNL